MDPVELLKELIAIPSVNPMGRNVTGPEFFETRLSDYLVDVFSKLGTPHERIEVTPGRANVIARCESRGASATVLLDAHQDTVPTDGMVIPPFTPVEDNGRLYGRGACDVKGGLASMLAAFARLARERPPGAANVVLSCTCDEESSSLGINDLVRLWTDPQRSTPLLPRAPDVAVVAEPTCLDIVVAHRGATRWKIKTSGRACHSSRPNDGVNAIYRMARVVELLEEFAAWLPASRPEHRLCGPATLSVGRIEGGSSVNIVPDWCTIDIDRRVLPGEDGWQVRDEVMQYLGERLPFEVEGLPPWIVGAALSDDLNGPWSDRLLKVIQASLGRGAKVGVPYGTHASRIAPTGVPAMVFGPGDIAQAHTKDEWIAVDQLRQAAEIYYDFCLEAGRT